MDNAIITRLRLIKSRLNDAIITSHLLYEKCRSNEGADKQELIQITNLLQSCTSNISNEIHFYIEKCSSIDQNEVEECTELQLQATERLSILNTIITVTNVKPNLETTLQSKLPKLTLPKFNGDVLQFHDFWDQFEAGVDSKSISEVDKLAYLLASLDDKAKEAVQGIGISKQNYKIVVDTLHRRFGNKTIMIDSHYEELQKIQMAGPSAMECRKVFDLIEKNLRILQSLGEDINNNQFRVTLLSKFPEKVIYELNKSLKGADSVGAIRAELDTIITAMESSQKTSLNDNNIPSTSYDISTTDSLFIKDERYMRPGTKSRNMFKRKLPNNFKSVNPKRLKIRNCVFCEEPHYNDMCPNMNDMLSRKRKLGSKCHNCFRVGHYARDCKVKMSCVYCKGRHNRALCPKKLNRPMSKDFISKASDENHCFIFNQCSFLQTATVTVRNLGMKRKIRLLLDSGSQRSYVTKKTVFDLNLNMNKEEKLMIFTFGSDKPTETISPSVEIEFITKRGNVRKIEANVVPCITEKVSVPKLGKIKNIDILADDGSAGESIDILIGNDYYYSFFKTESKKIADNLYLMNTEFGWIISGKVDSQSQYALSVITYCQGHGPECMYYTEPDLPLKNMDLTFLWSFESIGILDSPKSTREEEAVKHFNDTVQYCNNRYMVKWPWIEYPPRIPTNFGLAYGRLKGLLQRIGQSTLEEYQQIIKEQLESGVIEKIEINDDVTKQRTPPINYLPHHIVKQEGKRGRLVYDASGKLKDHKSLNECMYRGPSLIGDLLGILIQFRTNAIAITADVEKAFLQIGLQFEDRDVTRFLWLNDVHKPVSHDNLVHLRFCRVPFGIIASPFILTATLNYHIAQNYPHLTSKIADKCYVDNLVTGSHTIEEAQQLYQDTRRVFQDLSMNIREWNSNSTDFLETIPEELRSKDSASTKMLGLIWDTKKDTLRIKVKGHLFSEHGSTKDVQCKRELLSTIASLYDPCGFCSPIILPAKLLLQELWEKKFKWDTIFPEELKEKWEEIAEFMQMIQQVEIPRFACVVSGNDKVVYELHCFTDASKNAYAAALYLRSSNGSDTKVSLLLAKSKVTPLNEKENLNMPKLELLGYYIGSKLLTYVKNVIGLEISKQYLWTDSMIVLSWMKSNKLLPPFVSRRINTIKQNGDIQACYINSENNPADIATRPEMWLTKNDLWFHGPTFLSGDKTDWPQNMYHNICDSSVLGEGLNTENTNIITQTNTIINSNEELVIKNIKTLQHKYFPEEVDGKETHLTRNLKLYLDVDGILRCRGRMANANWTYDSKHPALIPRNSDFTSKLIQQIHEENYHVGVSHTLSLIREKYWIPQGRAQVQKILRLCRECVKHGGGPYKLPPTSDLPPERVNFSAPFTYTGMDYFGPLYINGVTSKEKRWVCLFTCLAVRAIHMEVVKDLTAEECLNAVRRFIAVRGRPQMIYSDNATLFKLTSEVLSTLIKWKFIPQLAPWHGGFYERMVGLVKHCMKRSLEKHLLKKSQLTTVIKEIEQVLNTRPLTCVGSEPECVLKPADFLTLGKCLSIQPTNDSALQDFTMTKQILIDGWKRGQKVLEEFKQMFSTQYLYSLRERYSYSPKQHRVTVKRSPKVGDIVQIKGNINNRNNWKVGKIISLVPGADGECRVAKIEIDNKEFTRSIAHLYPLEVEEEIVENKINEMESNAIREPTNKDGSLVPSVEINESPTNERDSTDSILRTEEHAIGKPANCKVMDEPNQDTAKLLTHKDHSEERFQEVPIRAKRKAAIRAMEKMAELTRSLFTQL